MNVDPWRATAKVVRSSTLQSDKYVFTSILNAKDVVSHVPRAAS
jgi:hypothetical protein